jgi:endonuclease/exonuclease/phosphatase family metal-dependent hydrolase
MTFNIKTGSLSSLETVADVIVRSGADVVGVQEVDRGTNRSQGVDQPRRLAELTRMQALFTPSLPDYDGGQYGLVVLVAPQLHVVSSQGYPLDQVEAGEQRAALRVEIAAGAGQSPAFAFINTHLDHRSTRNRASQAAQLNQIGRAAAAHHPVLLVGDLNATEGGETIDIIREFWTPTREQVFGIDWVVHHGPQWRPRSARELTALDHPRAREASDHVPVVADYELAARSN